MKVRKYPMWLTGAGLSVPAFFISDVNESQLAGLLKCKEFINVEIICVANTVIKHLV